MVSNMSNIIVCIKHILVFSGIGFLRQVVNVSGLNVIVKMEDDAKGLGEVIVLGYGQKTTKLTNTGSVSSITGQQIRQSPSASLQNSLSLRKRLVV